MNDVDAPISREHFAITANSNDSGWTAKGNSGKVYLVSLIVDDAASWYVAVDLSDSKNRMKCEHWWMLLHWLETN